jgi:hypothetical protein
MVSGNFTPASDQPSSRQPLSTLCGPGNVISAEWIDPLHVPRQRNFPPAPCTTESFINSVDYFDRNVPIADIETEEM